MNGKGSARRPAAVHRAELDAAWQRTFGPRVPEIGPRSGEPMSDTDQQRAVARARSLGKNVMTTRAMGFPFDPDHTEADHVRP